jgi:hypothetical protein
MGQCLPWKFLRIHRTYVLCLDWRKAWQFIGADARSSRRLIQPLDATKIDLRDIVRAHPDLVVGHKAVCSNVKKEVNILHVEIAKFV